MSSEYRPGFKAWLLSIFLAAGFGSLGADGLKYLVIESAKREATLVLRDKQCEGINPFVCNYYLENVGDKATYITKVVIGGDEHSTFFTNSPIEVFVADVANPVKRAHVAVSEPHKMLMIGLAIQQAQQNESTCFYKGTDILKCI